jgi:hypothetical protein
MRNKNLYLFPISILILSIAWWFFLLIWRINYFRRSPIHVIVDFWTFFWPALLLLQIIVYWSLRKKLFSKYFVLIHGWTTAIAFLALPMFFFCFSFLYTGPGRHDHYLFETMLRTRRIITWICVGAGNLLFILTIVKSFRKKETVNETPGLLDEFVS